MWPLPSHCFHCVTVVNACSTPSGQCVWRWFSSHIFNACAWGQPCCPDFLSMDVAHSRYPINPWFLHTSAPCITTSLRFSFIPESKPTLTSQHGYLGSIHDFVNGCSFYMWCHQHFLGHHPYTNVPDTDPDVHTNDPDIRRIKPNQKWYNHYRWQQLYAPLLYGIEPSTFCKVMERDKEFYTLSFFPPKGFLGIKFRIGDINMMYFLKTNGKIRVNPPGTWHYYTFLLGKLFWITYRVIIPSFYIPFGKPVVKQATSNSHRTESLLDCFICILSIGQVLTIVLVSDFVVSYYLALIFQVNHVVEAAIWPKVNEKTGKSSLLI